MVLREKDIATFGRKRANSTRRFPSRVMSSRITVKKIALVVCAIPGLYFLNHGLNAFYNRVSRHSHQLVTLVLTLS
jgi:hypothetical protein